MLFLYFYDTIFDNTKHSFRLNASSCKEVCLNMCMNAESLNLLFIFIILMNSFVRIYNNFNVCIFISFKYVLIVDWSIK